MEYIDCSPQEQAYIFHITPEQALKKFARGNLHRVPQIALWTLLNQTVKPNLIYVFKYDFTMYPDVDTGEPVTMLVGDITLDIKHGFHQIRIHHPSPIHNPL